MHQQPGAATAGEKTSAHSEVAHPPHSRIHSRSLSTLGHESAARSLTHSQLLSRAVRARVVEKAKFAITAGVAATAHN
jgi:hypothetical protein